MADNNNGSSSSSLGGAAPAAASSSSVKLHVYPSVVVVLVVLSVVLFCSGLLHLLARCLGRRDGRRHASAPGAGGSTASRSNSPTSAEAAAAAASNTLRGQLQHLFRMHDAGVDQALIDTLPVFLYGTIRGLKDGADCAVCLSEFGDADRLRLLPKCKHAFHHDCIDTWLLANSTCPLCRQSLLNPADGDSLRLTAFGSNNNPGAAAAAERQLQQLADDSRARACNPDAAAESVTEQLQELAVATGAPTEHSEPREQPSSMLQLQPEKESMLQGSPLGAGPTVCVTEADGTERVTRVQLGKVKFDSSAAAEDYDDNNNSGNEGFELQQQQGCSAISSCSGSAAAAATGRCYSMGSYQYIVDSTSFELTMAPTPYPGRPQLWGSAATPAQLLQRHTLHRSVLSDTIPELAAPANEDFFWASRGLNTPKSLSLVREMMTPSTESFLFSPASAAAAAAAAEPDHGFLHRRSSLLQPAMKDHPQQQQQQCHDGKLMEDDHQLMLGSKQLEESDQVTLVIRN
jgi:hypothetical protein